MLQLFTGKRSGVFLFFWITLLLIGSALCYRFVSIKLDITDQIENLYFIASWLSFPAFLLLDVLFVCLYYTWIQNVADSLWNCRIGKVFELAKPCFLCDMGHDFRIRVIFLDHNRNCILNPWLYCTTYRYFSRGFGVEWHRRLGFLTNWRRMKHYIMYKLHAMIVSVSY